MTLDDLGAPRASYRGTAQWNLPRLLAALLVAGLIVGPLHAAVVPSAILVCLLVGEYFAEKRFLAARNRLDLFERGLILTRGDRSWRVRYASATLTQRNARGPYVLDSYRSTLRDAAGETVTITGGIERPDEWSRTIREGVVTARLPGAWADLEAGRRLEFGRFWLTAQQVGYGGTAWPWSAVKSVEVSRGVLKVFREGSPRGLAGPVHRVPDSLLFVALAEGLRKRARS